MNNAGTKCTLAAAALLFAAAVAGQSVVQPQPHRVTGVAVGDVLNIRAAPSSNADDVGDLAAGAQPIEVLEIDPTGGWGRLLWDEADAWVSMRYLAPVDVPRLSGRARGAHAST